MSYGTQWCTVIFNDEIKWNLDRPNLLEYYWHDFRKKPWIFFSQQQGAGSLIICPDIFFNTQLSLEYLYSRQTAQNYVRTLEEIVQPFVSDICHFYLVQSMCFSKLMRTFMLHAKIELGLTLKILHFSIGSV